MQSSYNPGWYFIDCEGTFELPDPGDTSYLYLPLVNEAGMMSSVTPTFNGDAKADQNAFLLLPVSVEDLHNSRAARNLWVTGDGLEPWSVTGNSAAQTTRRLSAGKEAVTLRAGFLWQIVTRQHPDAGLQAEVTSFVPTGPDRVELMQVTLTNTGEKSLTLTPTAAIPIYGRSADNLRDHRHVTSLLHRTTCHAHGVLVSPILSFGERGHLPNPLTYAVLGAEGDGTAPLGFFMAVEDFLGAGGTLDWPEAVVRHSKPRAVAGDTLDGYESIGALRFREVELDPGKAVSYILILSILNKNDDPMILLERYGTLERFDDWLAQTRTFWREKLATLHFTTADDRFDGWLQWVTLQPILRRLMGNSFLPYHDYGRGGRGWRDLWQDILVLLLMESRDISSMLLSNFAGIRMDGSNATIVGVHPGEFKADRNNIPRAWMDHGAWPLLTTRLYIDQTGDLRFLLREQVYFKDHLTHRCQSVDSAWRPEQGTVLLGETGEPYRGTVLEHLLVQHLTAFFNVGEHNNILLEGADWNDALDMARQRGESVAFTALYAGNLRALSDLCLLLVGEGVRETSVAVDLLPLLDRLTTPADYADVTAKRQRLQNYFDVVQHAVSGEKARLLLVDLADDLAQKADWLAKHIRQNEWIQHDSGCGWFNGYYDNDGQRVEGAHPTGVRMTLTGQVFTLMGGIASDEQAQAIIRAADRYLYDPSVGGYHLNTNFASGGREQALKLSGILGRAFGFAFGHKENGAMFSHMAVMYANALYKRGLVKEGWKVLEGIYRHSQDFAASRMYPGIPEYFSPRGRGMYPYLTGSAAWYLLTLLTEVYGVRGHRGDLVIQPKLAVRQFEAGDRLAVRLRFAGKRLEVEHVNPQRLDYGSYRLVSLHINGEDLSRHYIADDFTVNIPRSVVAAWPDETRIIMTLGAKREALWMQKSNNSFNK